MIATRLLAAKVDKNCLQRTGKIESAAVGRLLRHVDGDEHISAAGRVRARNTIDANGVSVSGTQYVEPSVSLKRF